MDPEIVDFRRILTQIICPQHLDKVNDVMLNSIQHLVLSFGEILNQVQDDMSMNFVWLDFWFET